MRTVLLALAATCSLTACQDKPDASKAKPAAVKPAAATPAAATPAAVKPAVAQPAAATPTAAKPAAAKGTEGAKDAAAVVASAARRALMQYEKVRKALAADDLAGAKTAAGAFSAMSEPAAAPLVKVAAAITEAKDIAAARLAFGPLAKAALTVASSDKEAGKGGLAWQCPMAKGYQKWLQLDPDMANPYMGKRMLKCGGRVPLSP